MTSSRSSSIEQLQLVAVRTYERLTLSLSPGLTILVGPNGVGKTNVLEACAMALTGASPRTSQEQRLIREHHTEARIAARVLQGADVHLRDVTLRAGRGKQLRLDATPVRTIDAYASAVPCVTFLPERLLIIRGAPQRRRALIDQLVARLVSGSDAVQREYAHALQQRNALLRRARAGADVQRQLQPWTAQLVELGATLRSHRAQVLADLAAPYARRFADLTLLTHGSVTCDERGSGDLAADSVELAMAEQRRGTTLFGPHLDDIRTLDGERDLRAFGSAGEQRAALLAFTCASRDLIVAHTGVEPIVLLDEPWSELDADRRARLTRLLATFHQVLATSTEVPAHMAMEAPHAHVLQVSSGQVHPWPTPAETSI